MRTKNFARVVSLSLALYGGAALAADDAIKVPAGFSVTVVQEGLGAGRHLAVAANGDIYLAGRDGLVAMRDTNGDGKVDQTAKFGDVQGTGVLIHGDWLYVSDDVGVYRYPLKKGELAPSGARQTVVSGFPKERQHADKTFALDPQGTLYVNIGAPSNSCQQKDRQEGSLGQSPCPHPREVRRCLGVRRQQAQPGAGRRAPFRDWHAQCGGAGMEFFAERLVLGDPRP
jgi:glucose/arabinose dehydrogenase